MRSGLTWGGFLAFFGAPSLKSLPMMASHAGVFNPVADLEDPLTSARVQSGPPDDLAAEEDAVDRVAAAA